MCLLVVAIQIFMLILVWFFLLDDRFFIMINVNGFHQHTSLSGGSSEREKGGWATTFQA